MKRRMKRFVLAENTEKDKNWKSSDNLLMRAGSKINMIAKNGGGGPDAAEDTEHEKASHLSAVEST